MKVSLARSEPSIALLSFAEDVGTTGPVRVVGGRTQWDRGRSDAGSPDMPGSSDMPGFSDIREVRAPAGIVSVEPAELIVRAGAGTTWGELDAALAAEGMQCPVDGPSPESTLGGLFSVGDSGYRRIRYGHIRDLLLETRYVSARGDLVKAGAPVVKNVTGFDLCRLLVGSLGTIGLLGEVVLRCGPRPQLQMWMVSNSVDPFVVRERLYRPSFIGWNGTRTFVCMEGSAVEVGADKELLGTLASDWAETDKPVFPDGSRISKRPRDLREAPEMFRGGAWLAEIGVGVVHLDSSFSAAAFPVAPLGDAVLALAEKLKHAYDPDRRLNPGVRP